MSRLLIECTYVFEHPQDNSGIQRVVRNIIGQLPHIDTARECIPVIMRGDSLHRVLSLAPIHVSPLMPRIQRWIVRLDHWRNRYWFAHSRIERRWPFRVSRSARRALYVLCRLASLGITLPLRALLAVNRRAPDARRSVPLEALPGDQLVLLDSSWHADFFALAERLKARGVGIVSVIYDLIPLTHPQFCDAGLVRVFDQWFDWIARVADGYIAISGTISAQVRAELTRRLGEREAQTRWHDHFPLGSDLDLAVPDARVAAPLARIFDRGAPVYLMVSTIEPRKNHAYLLDAFERLWAQRSPVRLCIVGKVGWKVDSLIERIRRHPEFGRRLFMCNGLSDADLAFAYAHARALVFPSFVEGFGLPLVEAMQRKLPAMASDIPVFREIGRDFMAYFDAHDPATLATLIERFERTGRFPATRALDGWCWPGWRAASEDFIARVCAGTAARTACVGSDTTSHAHRA